MTRQDDSPATVKSRHLNALRVAAGRSALAPSIHNTQPWRFVMGDGYLDVFADFDRQLRVIDPSARQLHISCACAVLNARVGLAGMGYGVTREWLPDPNRTEHIARLTIDLAVPIDDSLVPLDGAISERQTNRRRFFDEEVPSYVVRELIDAAEMEGASLFPIAKAEHRLSVALISQQADQFQLTDPAYRAEVRSWTTNDSERRDGVPAFAVPHVDVGSQDDIPLRDFDTQGTGGLPVNTGSSLNQCLLLLGTEKDDQLGWLRAGEALERVSLLITWHGLAASPMTQMIEVPTTRERLRQELSLPFRPHVLLRVGRAKRTPPTRRRRLVDVLSEDPRPDT